MEDEVFRSEERLEFAQALWMYTVGAAYAAHCEHILGRRFCIDILLNNTAASKKKRFG